MTEKQTPRITRLPDGRRKIFDRLRGRLVALTPEEFVRQTFVDYLVDQLCYPAGLMANEISITLNSTSRRCDTVLFNRDRSPLMIIEYKAPDIAITQSVFEQIARYNLVMGARYLIVTNGRSHYCCRLEPDGHYTFLQDIPPYSDLDIGR